MKKAKFILVGTIIFYTIHLYSQDRVFKPFKTDLGITFDVPSDNNSGTGSGFYIEPRYSIDDNLTVGFRVEGLYLNSEAVKINFTSVDIGSTTTVTQFLITGEYCFSDENVRPFLGVGLGMYKKTIHSAVDVSVLNGLYIGSRKKTTNFGFAPKIGLNIGHIRLAAIYNFTGENISDYLGIQLGIEFGGGRIEKKNN